MIFIATEVSYDTSVEYVMARQKVNILKARYAAKAGVEISLLRIVIYKKVVAGISNAMSPEQAQPLMSLLDPIWQMPFTWPPVLPDQMTGTDKSNVDEIVKVSPMDAQYLATIYSEGGKIDINDLSSVSKQIQKVTAQQILNIFKTEVLNNEKFSAKYRDTRFEELVNNIIDWEDENSESLNGGDERDKYKIRSDFLPPNAPFKTIKELNMVAGMNEDFFNLLSQRVTLFGTKGVNVNYANEEVISSLDPSIKGDILNALIKRRTDPNEGGLYRNEDDFFQYATRFGANVEAIKKSGIPLLFGPEYNFRIISTGEYGKVKVEITAITYDMGNLQSRYSTLLDKDSQDLNNPNKGPGTVGTTDTKTGNPSDSQGKNPTGESKTNIIPPKGRPIVVYWEEK